jgi:DNA helicase-2/ATP-dependent DNA helicase PcrA
MVGAGAPWIGTFHALGVHILRSHGRAIGIPARFTIFDRADSLSALKKGMRRTDIDPNGRAPGYSPKTFEPGRILAAISREKGNMVTAKEFEAQAGNEYMSRIIAGVWMEYERILAEEKSLDFDDLLLKTALLLKNEQNILEHYQKRWRYIHIDEYQDTNRVQYALARYLAGAHRNIGVVGDTDQNIYSFRGANIKNILDFEKDYPEGKVVLLEENYRSTQTILSAANRVIEKNKMRREKTLFTQNPVGEKLGLFGADDETNEAHFVAQTAKKLIAEAVPPREIAVLFRANFQSRALEEAFLSAEAPYQVVGTRFFERKEIKDMLSYIRASRGEARPGDLSRIINVPPRGLGKVALLKILSDRESELPPAAAEKVKGFRALLLRIKEKLETEKLSVALRFILTASGLETNLKAGDADDMERLENIRELVTVSLKYDHLPPGEAVERFLEDAALQSDQDEIKEERNAVRLMTVHAAKGLEFDYVFITGLEQDLFPHARQNDERKHADEAEEERRLFYVALTRAKKKVFLTYASVRTLFGSRQVSVPSEFIFDIPEEYLEAEEQVASSGKTIYFE